VEAGHPGRGDLQGAGEHAPYDAGHRQGERPVPARVLSDCVVYPSAGPSPLHFLPRTPDGKPVPGSFRLGPTPGLAKLEGVKEMA
jgi:hypothetical protein